MSFTVVDVAQRSPEWFGARLGRLTGSKAAEMLAAPRGGKGESTSRRNLRVRLVLERLTNRPVEKDFKSRAMEQGVDREADAAAIYQALTGRLLSTSGFLSHDELMAGCSLDGHVGDFEGLIEIKSPIAATHLEYLQTGKIPNDYYWQVIHALWITGAPWCDWMSFNPDFPDPLQVKLVRVTRYDKEIHAYDSVARAFLAEVEAERVQIAEMAKKASA